MHPSPEAPKSEPPRGKYLLSLSMGALGVVFGDIGTSPLYAIRECFVGEHALPLSRETVFGVLSLLFWSVTIVISLKYMAVVLRANNRGEGGILALMMLTQPHRKVSRTHWGTLGIMIGIFGAALLFGDGAITPAISVLSAMEGLEVISPTFKHAAVPLTAIVLFLLFSVQRTGSARIGRVFGPIMILWFATLAALGISGIAQNPDVLHALNPYYGYQLFAELGWPAFVILGSVFLAVTGGEALYADMGHFGVKPIRLVWFTVALPGLVLNYFGQGAYLLSDAGAVEHPFFHMVPRALLIPTVVLATLATVIASQALISGVFSLTRQAVMLGYLPRLKIIHTSSREIGQIYIPAINWALLGMTLMLVFTFRSSGNLAAAYGIAVSTTMIITTCLIFVLAKRRWGVPRYITYPAFAAILFVDGAFFVSNMLKFTNGGWVPLLIGTVLFTVMTTWRRGRDLLYGLLRQNLQPLEGFVASIHAGRIHRVDGTAIYMTGDQRWTPPALVHNITHNKVVHESLIFLTVLVTDEPMVNPENRIKVRQLNDAAYTITAFYGFMETPKIFEILSLAQPQVPFNLDPHQVSFFLGRETVVATEQPGMAVWRERLFTLMSRNAQRATDYFGIPRQRVVEMGLQIEL